METAIKERGMLFSTAMVQAIQDGRKTQTRRVIKTPIDIKLIDWLEGEGEDRQDLSFAFCSGIKDEDGEVYPDGWAVWATEYPEEGSCYLGKCPHGKVGDRIWVRETWNELDGEFYFKAAPETWPVQLLNDIIEEKIPTSSLRWKPSLFMKKEICRLFLEITNIRVERLQVITMEDARQEGIQMGPENNYKNYLHPYQYSLAPDSSFATLWQSINGLDSWDANPWVWVIEFKVVQP